MSKYLFFHNLILIFDDKMINGTTDTSTSTSREDNTDERIKQNKTTAYFGEIFLPYVVGGGV
jgi:hypothetical protein